MRHDGRVDTALTPSDVTTFDAAWRRRWAAARPIGHELRSSAAPSWVRFHSLPGSQRYATTDSEYEELLHRQSKLLAELCSLAGTSTHDLWVVTASWSDSPEPAGRDAEVIAAFPAATYWKSVPQDLSLADDPVWAHLYVGRTALDSERLRALLLLVADAVTGGVILSPRTCDWLVHPYDGGIDVIAADPVQRELLRSRYTDWLSAHPGGL